MYMEEALQNPSKKAFDKSYRSYWPVVGQLEGGIDTYGKDPEVYGDLWAGLMSSLSV